MMLTYELLTDLFNFNAPNLPQAKILGLPNPLKPGWMEDLIGIEIPDDVYQFLLSIKGSRPSNFPKLKWKTLHKTIKWRPVQS